MLSCLLSFGRAAQINIIIGRMNDMDKTKGELLQEELMMKPVNGHQPSV